MTSQCHWRHKTRVASSRLMAGCKGSVQSLGAGAQAQALCRTEQSRYWSARHLHNQPTCSSACCVWRGSARLSLFDARRIPSPKALIFSSNVTYDTELSGYNRRYDTKTPHLLYGSPFSMSFPADKSTSIPPGRPICLRDEDYIVNFPKNLTM